MGQGEFWSVPGPCTSSLGLTPLCIPAPFLGPSPRCASPEPSLSPEPNVNPCASQPLWAPFPLCAPTSHALSGPQSLWVPSGSHALSEPCHTAPATTRWSEEASGDVARAETQSESAEAGNWRVLWALLGGCPGLLQARASCPTDSGPWREAPLQLRAYEKCGPGAQGVVSTALELHATVTLIPKP